MVEGKSASRGNTTKEEGEGGRKRGGGGGGGGVERDLEEEVGRGVWQGGLLF